MKKDILICGVGGQGTVLAGKILAAAAMDEGEKVHSAETIGMAQRGGSVTGHVRIGEDVYSPLIPPGSADLLLAFEPSEAVRNLGYLRPDGLAVVNTAPVRPVSGNLSQSPYDGRAEVEYLMSRCACLFTDANEICAPFGSTRFFNIILLGLASGSGRLGIKPETIVRQIERLVPERFVSLNKQAFECGVRSVGKSMELGASNWE